MLLLALGCAPKPAPPPAPVPAPTAGNVEVSGVVAKAPPREVLLRGLAAAPAAPCYADALTRDPGLYGEVVVRFSVVADGHVDGAEVVLSTLSDDAAVQCLVGVVKTLSFPGVTPDRLTAVYPFVLTSDATPPVVARALKVKYGLLPAEPEGDPVDPKGQRPPGVVYLW